MAFKLQDKFYQQFVYRYWRGYFEVWTMVLRFFGKIAELKNYFFIEFIL